MRVKAIWEFDVDVEDIDPKFVDIKGFAEDSARMELKYLLKQGNIETDDFNYEVED